MTTIDQIINSITNFKKEITNLQIKKSDLKSKIKKIYEEDLKINFQIIEDVPTKSNIKLHKENYDTIKKNMNKTMINYLQMQDLIKEIEELNKEISELEEFQNKNHDWTGGKCLGEIIDTPDGCRIRFDEQSRSFKFQNYKKCDTTIICGSKEECLVQAKKYLYDYYIKLGKISNQYRLIHPKYIQVKLSNELTFITDCKFIDLIENNKISSKYEKRYDNHYVMYLSGHREHSLFYKLIGKYSRVKYLNGNTLDLRVENLEESDNSVLVQIPKEEVELNEKTGQFIKPVLNKDGHPYNTWILGKPGGTVFERTNRNTWSVVVKKDNGSVVTKTLTFNKENKDELYKKALEIRNQLSDVNGLTRNQIRIISDQVIEVKLTQDQIMKTDYKFINLIQKHNLFSTKSSSPDAKYYVSIEVNGKLEKFHKHITDFDMVDHIDRNPMNNCLSNLRKADHKLNNNNRSKSESSMAEVLGVTYCSKDNAFKARIKQNDIEHSKQFSVKKYGYEQARQMAINARKEFNTLFSCDNG